MEQFYKNERGTYIATNKIPIYDGMTKKDVYDCQVLGLRNIYTATIFVEEIERDFKKVDKTTNIYLNLLTKYRDKQMIKATEELSELTQAIDKMMIESSEEHKDNLTEEIADVEIMLEQVKLYYNIDQNAVEAEKQAKIERTIERCLKND